MLTETIQLETLRQKIEDAEYESGSQADYLDRGRPTPAQAKKAQELSNRLLSQSNTMKEELKELIAQVRSQQPKAIEEWVNFHIAILQKIVEEKSTAQNAGVRRSMARDTLQAWEKVRTGELDYVNINWYFLKDYRESVRKIAGKSWWQFWK